MESVLKGLTSLRNAGLDNKGITNKTVESRSKLGVLTDYINGIGTEKNFTSNIETLSKYKSGAMSDGVAVVSSEKIAKALAPLLVARLMQLKHPDDPSNKEVKNMVENMGKGDILDDISNKLEARIKKGEFSKDNIETVFDNPKLVASLCAPASVKINVAPKKENEQPVNEQPVNEQPVNQAPQA